jgi:hypothetical protein
MGKKGYGGGNGPSHQASFTVAKQGAKVKVGGCSGERETHSGMGFSWVRFSCRFPKCLIRRDLLASLNFSTPH